MNHNIEKLIVLGGDPILKQVCEKIEPGEPTLWIDTLRRVAKKHPRCAGLAAPQIGVAKCAFVMHHSVHGTSQLRTFINPEIISHSEETEVAEEECLSYPGKKKAIRRFKKIVLKFQTITRAFAEEEFEGFSARVAQHEIDHLSGICLVGDESVVSEQLPETKKHSASTTALLMASILSMGIK